jgi:hypothetical protein
VKSYPETIQLVEQQRPDRKIVKVYPIDFLLSLRNIGAKILPTYADSIKFNMDGLITDKEFAACPEAYGGPCRFLYLNPNFWTEERIRKEWWRFEGVRVLPGKTYIYLNGKVAGPYRLYILDIDSFNAYEKLKDLLENDLLLNTYVTESYKTKDGKTFGYHVYWLEDWNENDNCVNITPDDCKNNGEFEIFTGVKYTQFAGHHREHVNFYYHNVGCRNLKGIYFMIRNGLYNQILHLLNGLLLNPQDIEKRRKSQRKNKDPFYGGREATTEKYNYDFRDAESHHLTLMQIKFAVMWALPFYGTENEDATKHYFHFSTAFISTLVRQNISGKSIKVITDMLYDFKPDPKYRKESWQSWCDSSILLWKSGGGILGISSLKKQVQTDPEYGDEESAEKHIFELLDILNLGRTNKFTSKKNESGLTKHETLRQREHERDLKLAEERLSERDIDFAFQCVITESPYDRASILQLMHGCFSAFTKTPISHILSSLISGAGKNHLIRLATSYIPEQYVVMYNRLSDKALFHMSGEMVIRKFDYENGKEQIEPVENYLKELYNRLRGLQRKSRKSKTHEDLNEIDAIHDEIKDVLEATQKLITLDNLIQVFLDTPPESLWEACMSLLSQDSARDQFYTFTDRVVNESLGAKTSRLRGAPTIISAGVIDDTSTLRFAEKNRRLVHVNPNTSALKIGSAIQATNDQRLGLPEEYEEDYISAEDKERAKHIFDVVIAKVRLHSEQFGFKDPGVYMPKIVRTAIRDSIKVSDGKVWSMTINERLLRYFTVVGLERIDNRLRIFDEKTGESRILLSFSDLEKTLELMNRISSQVRPYVAEFYNDAILPTYKEHEDNSTGIRDGKEVRELERGISSKQIQEYLKKHGMEVLDKKIINERYLKPLVNQGILNEIKSEIDRRGWIYSPVEGFETGISSLFDDDIDPRLSVIHSEYYPSMDRLQKEFERLSARTYRKTGDILSSRYKIKNSDGDEIDFAKMKNYLGNSEKCFKMGFLEEEEKCYSKSKNTCLGGLFGHLKNQKADSEFKKSIKEVKNPYIVDDVTIEQKSQPGGDRRKIQNTLAKNDLKNTLVAPLQNPQTVPNFPPIFSPNLTTLETLKTHFQDLDQSLSQSIAKIRDESKSLILPDIPQFKNHVAFDCEWYREDLQSNIDTGRAGRIYCACFIDSKGTTVRLHLKDFNCQHEKFMTALLDILESYEMLMGYAINESKYNNGKSGIDGDIVQLRKNCIILGPEFEKRFESLMIKTKVLDLYDVFKCKNIKASLRNVKKIEYQSNSLHDVALACLKESKLHNLSGSEVENLSYEIQTQYCLQDALLCLKLSRQDNFELLKILYNLSKEIGIDFFSTCNYASAAFWWRNYLELWHYPTKADAAVKWEYDYFERNSRKDVRYRGGHVFEPLPGMYENIVVYDVESMYPTMGKNHNISGEIINCECCKDNPAARIPIAVMKIINLGLLEKMKEEPGKGWEPRKWIYHICLNQRGIFTQIMDYLFKKKSDYKKQGLLLETNAVKLLANSGYGVFGYSNFKHYNFRVSELITGFAKYTLLKLEAMLRENRFQIIYGDTDSLFIDNRDDRDFTDIKNMASKRYGVEFSKDKVWKIVGIPDTKQYFGILDNDKHYYTTMPGLKSDRTPYENEVTLKLIRRENIELFYSNKDRQTSILHIIDEVRSAFNILNNNIYTKDMEFIINKLMFRGHTTIPLDSTKSKDWHKHIFDELVEDYNGDLELARMNSLGGSVHKYWKINHGNGKERKSATMHPERYTLNINKYREGLWACVVSILKAYGVPDEECVRLENELVKHQKEFL